MKNEELLEEIESRGESEDAAVEEEKIRFLIARIRQQSYAFPAQGVREIVTDAPIHRIPFVPPYIRGLIDHRGEPHTVFDLDILFEKQVLDADTYLICDLDGDRIAFLISEIIEIISLPKSGIHALGDGEDQGGFFAGALGMEEEEIPIINIPSLIRKLSDDLRR